MRFSNNISKLVHQKRYLLKYEFKNDHNVDLVYYNAETREFHSDFNFTPLNNMVGFIAVDELLPENNIKLGKKGFWYYVQLILLTPLWASRVSDERKTWEEFKGGLISHKHEFDFENPSYDNAVYKTGKHYKCKHLGCNLVEVKNPDGTWC